ncbi:MAG: alpha/beta hydrolase, partial [bacterium]|nr:alpha/beta hydrolase [bacterium]
MRNLISAGLSALAIFLFPALAAASPRVGELSFEPYTFVPIAAGPLDAERGRLTVPENRRDRRSRLIEVALVRLPSRAEEPGPPIVFLGDAPQHAATETARSDLIYALHRMRDLADVILLDQRGSGLSSPRLDCPQRIILPFDQPTSAEGWIDEYRLKSQRCAATWRARGVDLSGYNARESADDIEDLRRALGEPSLVLWGVGYGTHIALDVLARRPDTVERAILHAPQGGDHLLTLPQLADRAFSQIAARSDRVHPGDLRATLENLLAELSARPVTVRVVRPVNGKTVKVTIGGFDLALYLARGLADREILRTVPALLADLERGEYTVLATAAVRQRRQPLPSAATFAMHCASGASGERRRLVRSQLPSSLVGRAMNLPYPEVCDAWPVADLGDGFRRVRGADVPVLFVTANLDGRTPMHNARELSRHFPQSVEIVLAGGSHWDTLTTERDSRMRVIHPQVEAELRDFLDGRPVSSRVVALPVRFLSPQPPITDYVFDVHFAVLVGHEQATQRATHEQASREVEILNRTFVTEDRRRIVTFRLKSAVTYEELADTSCELLALGTAEAFPGGTWFDAFNGCDAPRVRDPHAVNVFVYDCWSEEYGFRDLTSMGTANGNHPFIALDWVRL